MKPSIAISTFFDESSPVVLSGENFSDNLVLAKGLGYQGIDLFTEEKPEKEIGYISELVNHQGLEISMLCVVSLAQRGVNLSDIDPVRRKESVRKFKQQIDVADKLDTKTMPVGFLRGNSVKGERISQYYYRLAESLIEITEYASKYDIDICLEPINRYEMQSFLRIEQALDFIQSYKIERLKILPDFFHMNIEERSLIDSLVMAGDKIAHVHATDSNRLAPGHGHLAYYDLLKVLKEINYNGFLAVEAFPMPNTYECAAQGAKYLLKILHEIEN